MYMDVIKPYSDYYNLQPGMEFQIEKCAMLIMKKKEKQNNGRSIATK